ATQSVFNPVGYGYLVFAPAANGSGSNYASFNYVVNDGFTDSSPAAISINLAPPFSPTVVSSGPTPNRAYQLLVTGDSNTTYCVWSSTNLADWTFLGPATQFSPGQFLYLDNAAANFPSRFYSLSTGCLASSPQFIGYARSDAGFTLNFSGATNSAYRVWA